MLDVEQLPSKKIKKESKKTVLIDFVQKPAKSFDVESGIENWGSRENRVVQIEKNLISACLWDVATLLKWSAHL